MLIFRLNPRRWIRPLIFIQFLPFAAFGQPETGDDYSGASERQAGIVIAIATFVFVAFYCVTCWFRRCRDHGFVTDLEGGGVVMLGTAARGLDAPTIESFPSFRYVEVKGLKLGNGELECAVCLSEFEDDETLRLMSPCSHVFHARCIDPWLLSRSTCPVCRVDVVPEPWEMFLRQVEGSNTNLGDEETRDLESSARNVIDHVDDDDKPHRSGSTEPPDWLGNRISFSRSRSLGHFMAQTDENLGRFTLRLPEEVRRRLTKTYTVKWTRSHRTHCDDVEGKTNMLFVHGRRNNR